MRKLFLPCLLFLTLTLFAAGAPARAALDKAPQQPLFATLSEDFVKGALFYGETVSGWFHAFLGLFGIGKPVDLAAAKSCDVQVDCPSGLACINACAGTSCDVWQKKCIRGPSKITVEPLYGPCGKDDVCAKGTVCTTTCPAGEKCTSEAHCLPPRASLGSCSTDLECLSVCGQQTLPPIGTAGFRAVCREGACNCDVQEVDPALTRVRCSDAIRADRNMVCPAGTTAACVADLTSHGNVRLTCLTAPEYGGTCLEDASCANAQCPAGDSPFCDTSDDKCRCRGSKLETITCDTDDQCGSVACDPGDAKVCRQNACACAKTTTTEQPATCSVASDCPAVCASGYSAACVSGACACQRTTTQAVSCTDVSQCGAVSCPDGYSKACVSSVCACTRTVQQ